MATLANPKYGTESGAIRVRGSALAVGRRRATRSARRWAWILPANAWTAFRDHDVTPELRVFRELWTAAYDGEPASARALLLHRNISQQLADGATYEQIKQYLTEGEGEVDNQLVYSVIAGQAHWAFNNPRPLGWPTVSAPRWRRIMRRILWGVQP